MINRKIGQREQQQYHPHFELRNSSEVKMRNTLEKIAKQFSGKGIDKKFPFFVWIYKKFFAFSSPEGEVEISIPLKSKILVSKKDSGLGLALRTKGEFEPLQTRKFIKSVKKGAVVFDIGANVGYYTVLASKLVGRKGRVYAFEPDRKNIKLLKRNVELNNCQNVEILPLALGAKNKVAYFLSDGANPGEGRISTKVTKELIEVKTLDRLVKEKSIKKVDVLKVDVEGGETDVLKGAKTFLTNSKDTKIFIECNPSALSRFGYSADSLKAVLTSFGFKVKNLIDERARKTKRFNPRGLRKVLEKSSFVVFEAKKVPYQQEKTPLVSVLMTAFNAEKYIAEALESILGQTYKNLELIIVNDGSRDKTASIVETYVRKDSRIKFYNLKTNLGSSKASNFGMKKAGGDFIARIDADDVAKPDRLEKQVNFLLQNPEVVLVGGQCKLIDAEGRIIGDKNFPTKHRDIYRSLFSINPIQHPACMINRRHLPENHVYYHNHFLLAHDLELVFELAKYGSLANIRKVVLFYRQHKDSLSLRNPKETFLATLRIRFKAVRKYGYKPSVAGILVTSFQAILAFFLPSALIYPLYSFVRGLKLRKGEAFSSIKPALAKVDY